MELSMKIIIKNLFLTVFFLFSTATFAGLPDLYKVLGYIDSSNEININSSQKDVRQAIRVLLANNDLEQIIVQKNLDGSIIASQKGEQIANALFGRSVPNPYLIVESIKSGIQLLLDPVKRDQYNKIRIASDERADFNARLQALESLPSIDLQLKMGFGLSNEDAKRGQKLTTEAEQWLMNVIKDKQYDDILRVAAIKALKNSSGYNEEVKNELLDIVKKQGLVSPQLRMASAEVLWVFNLNSSDITALSGIARNSSETVSLRARIFHTIEIKAPQHVVQDLYVRITGETLGEIYTSRSLPPLPVTRQSAPRTMYLANAMGYGEQPGTTYTIGRDHELERVRRERSEIQQIQSFKEELLKIRGSTGRCSGAF